MLEADILTFIQLVETLSFTKTAAKQNSTQATISRRIKELEARLNLHLVKRDTRNITITEAGKKLYNGIKKQELELNNLINSLHNEKAQIEGTINVSIPHAMGYALISPKIGKFIQQNPGINLNLFYQSNSVNLISDQFDIAIIGHMPRQQTSIIRLLAKFKAQLYCSPSYITKFGEPQTLEELKQHVLSGWINNDFSVPKHLRVTRVSTSEELIVENATRILYNSALHAAPLAEEGNVIVGAWDYLVQKELDSGKLVKILPDYIFGEIPYYLIRLPNSKNAVIDVFIKFIEECFSEIN